MFSRDSGTKIRYTYFATIEPNGGNSVYLSAYGDLASMILERYIEGHREDYEELFAKWDKFVQTAKSQNGFSTSYEVEDGYVYISSFQDGIGVSVEEDQQPSK